MDSILENSVDENSLDDNLDDTISKMFNRDIVHALGLIIPTIMDDYDDLSFCYLVRSSDLHFFYRVLTRFSYEVFLEDVLVSAPKQRRHGNKRSEEYSARTKLIEVLNSPCFMVKSWLVHDQTVHALASPKANELTIPEQTATGKGTSNPFMAGSLPKTTKPT
ncbi:hypothetical protein Tco_0456415 [Tanacetum coccineum]